jgi:hypothetical protein
VHKIIFSFGGKIPQNAQLCVLTVKKIISHTFRISGTLIVKEIEEERLNVCF